MASPREPGLRDLHDWWQAANYLTVGQIYLLANPMLQEPLRPEHIKPRLLGHWGTSPGPSLVYAHLNRRFHLAPEALKRAGGMTDFDLYIQKCKISRSASRCSTSTAAMCSNTSKILRKFETGGGRIEFAFLFPARRVRAHEGSNAPMTKPGHA